MGALDGRVAVITGVGRGIGREHALLFAKEGAGLIINDLGGANDGFDISPLVAYLSSESGTITGKVYDVRGGSIAEIAGWHPVHTTETDKPWTIAEIEQRLADWE